MIRRHRDVKRLIKASSERQGILPCMRRFLPGLMILAWLSVALGGSAGRRMAILKGQHSPRTPMLSTLGHVLLRVLSRSRNRRISATVRRQFPRQRQRFPAMHAPMFGVAELRQPHRFQTSFALST